MGNGKALGLSMDDADQPLAALSQGSDTAISYPTRVASILTPIHRWLL